MKTILVVDDEAELRNIIVEVLTDPGRDVVAAADAYEAVRVLAERPVDLLITDVRLPGLNGFQLARQAKLMRPQLLVVYMSGYYSETERGDGAVFGLLIRKPFRPDDLRREIDNQLAETRYR